MQKKHIGYKIEADSELIEEVVKEYKNLFSTGHSEMQKDELVFVPDKESKRGEDWLRTTLPATIARVRQQYHQELSALIEEERKEKHDNLINPKELKNAEHEDWRWDLIDISSTHAEAHNRALDRIKALSEGMVGDN